MTLFFSCYGDHRDLHSFPTRRSSDLAIEQEAEKCPEAQRLMTHPGVGPLTALAFVLIIGKAERFQCGKQIASYLGLDRKSTRLNSSHTVISYAVFCLKKKKRKI